ncbi:MULTISPECIES: hypothetical protein [Klebsiella]|uniref:hypothetical protein n=1 Tax=Klebsiella TaxID=570 RepID=UPI002877B1D6|nr:hypothetical protein [Klebsiella pasteurii]MDS7906833.1 hypothetical protein [Klebsiella pasteurii]MDV0995666.1 hypothetical protein [Klebsiella pasteurii]MDV1069302.1 hypothetical protein [Klebsiella pasteurii]MDV1075307.1 hypothetical protein [Klebsiella pasteurii]WND08106.1 hypothetical protein RIV03_16720 [Klebsiella pasteurii]
MDSPLVISAAIFLAAVGVGLWSQYCLPRLSDNRNILFIICFFLGLGSAASCLFHLLFLLIEGQSAQGGSAWFGPLIVLGALWKPLNYIAGKLDAVLTKNRGKK